MMKNVEVIASPQQRDTRHWVQIFEFLIKTNEKTGAVLNVHE